MSSHCYSGLNNLKGNDGSYNALISSKKAVHGLVATAQGPRHGDRFGSGKRIQLCDLRKASARLYYYWMHVKDALYQSVLPKGRRNVTQCFSTKCDHVARLNLLSHSKMQPL
ncbi:hypothetical protein K492DRAFT_198906 [Lichtheimia hyalospora FSU 10163]|nr:hypothetical protein K492DRAFT_198906 [Lichtheimia hyalospora FSU 10163]